MKIALLGDTALYGKFCVKENPDLYNYLSSVKKELEGYDYVVLNLETPFVNNQKPWGHKSAFIKSAPENVEVLKYLGVDSVCLANNHMFDYGQSSFQYTKELLDKYGIRYFGVEDKVDLIEIAGNKIAFSGYCCYSTNPQGLAKTGVNKLDYKEVEQSLIHYQNLGYTNIISVHAGQEHVNYPNYDHIKFARKLSSVCQYVYYGHHPHVLQGIETVNNSLLAYSLGNFCFDDVYTSISTLPIVKMSDNNKSSVIVSLEYKDSTLIGFEMIPLFDCVISEGVHKNKISSDIKKYSEKLREDKTEYVLFRQQLLAAYIEGRKSKRDLNWYLKRINYNSFKMVLNSYRNQKKYNNAIIKHLCAVG